MTAAAMTAAARKLLDLLPLTPTEYRVLRVLVDGMNKKWVGKFTIARHGWPDWEFDQGDETWPHMVEVNVHRIRRKMAAHSEEIQQATGSAWEITAHTGWAEYALGIKA